MNIGPSLTITEGWFNDGYPTYNHTFPNSVCCFLLRLAELMSDIPTVVSLVNLAVTISGGFIFLMTIKSRQAVQDVLLQRLSDDVERLSKTLEALRRGDGWIQAPMNRHVDREY